MSWASENHEERRQTRRTYRHAEREELHRLAILLLRTTNKFGMPPSSTQLEKLRHATSEQLDLWEERIFIAASFDELLLD